MTDNNNDSYDGFDGESDDLEPKGGGSSRTFIIAIAILAVVFLVFVASMVILLPMLKSSNNAQYLQQASQINAQNTATSLAATQVALTMDAQGRITPSSLPTTAPPPTSTPVVVVATEVPGSKGVEAATPEPTGIGVGDSGADFRTATISALFTQAAMSGGGTSGTYPVSSTALPNTGFMDELGLPGMIGVALVLVAVVVFVRRFRLTDK